MALFLLDTRLPKSRAGGQGPYLRSLDHLGRSSVVKDENHKQVAQGPKGLKFVLSGLKPVLSGVKSALPVMKSVLSDSRPKRADFRPERINFRPERADFRPERVWGDGRT